MYEITNHYTNNFNSEIKFFCLNVLVAVELLPIAMLTSQFHINGIVIKCDLCGGNEGIEIIFLFILTHWGRVMHMHISKLTTIGWDNGLVLSRWQAII